MDYSRATVRAYFAGLTPDSRPCRPGRCPIQEALGLEYVADATRLDSVLARVLDRLAAAEPKGSMRGWSQLSAGAIVAAIDALDADETGKQETTKEINARHILAGYGWGPLNVGNPGGPLPAYRFCASCGGRTDYQNPTCLYPYRHNGASQDEQ